MTESSGAHRAGAQWRKWVEHLHRLASPVVSGVDLRAELERALVRPQWIAGPLLARALQRQEGGGVPVAGRAAIERGVAAARDDVALWWALSEPAAGPVSRWIDPAASGPLFRQDLYQTIEVWTETELCALHAISHHACAEDSSPAEALQGRIERAVAWHLEHTQPDNATNRPWAAHVFLLHGTAESMHFAETLVSNSMVLNGRPDALSAWILLDSADALARALD